MSAKADRLSVVSDWHPWEVTPPDRSAGKVRCFRHGIQFFGDAACSDEWWPHRDVQWQETWKQRPQRRPIIPFSPLRRIQL
jgi:hypothetical protein